MSFIHLRYLGETVTPWHVGRLPQRIAALGFPDLQYTRTDLMWGRGLRGPILRQLWRSYCPLSDSRDGAAFRPEDDCPKCSMLDECPFGNLRGSDDEGEWKDKPRLIFTNLRFRLPADFQPPRLTFTTLDEEWLGTAEERGPYTVEYIPPGTRFEFEVILMADGARFEKEFDDAVRTSLKFFGWGGRCNEGFGRGRIIERERAGYEEFWRRYVSEPASKVLDRRELDLRVELLLILDKDGGGYYTSTREEGFLEKFCNCVNERYWQFTSEHIYAQEAIKGVEGGRPGLLRGWSRKLSRELIFKGISDRIRLMLGDNIEEQIAEAIALARYGIGRYKNQGFGSLLISGDRGNNED
ncbi:MAG: hypothetical protein QW794_05015 [Thermosphaera sp.]